MEETGKKEQLKDNLYTMCHKKSQLIFICNFVKNKRILMSFFTVKFKLEAWDSIHTSAKARLTSECRDTNPDPDPYPYRDPYPDP